MKYMLGFFIATGFSLFGISPVLRGGICDGNFLCGLFLLIVAVAYSPYFPYFLGLTALIFIVLTVFRRSISFGKDSKSSIFLSFIYSVFLSFISIFFIFMVRTVKISFFSLLSYLSYPFFIMIICWAGVIILLRILRNRK
jgi:hypothetical protein